MTPYDQDSEPNGQEHTHTTLSLVNRIDLVLWEQELNADPMATLEAMVYFDIMEDGGDQE